MSRCLCDHLNFWIEEAVWTIACPSKETSPVRISIGSTVNSNEDDRSTHISDLFSKTLTNTHMKLQGNEGQNFSTA
jgi:hypothetical protein